MGVAYDVFGNGKTSLKVNFGKFLQPANNDGTFMIANPAVTFQRDARPGRGVMRTDAISWLTAS